MKILLVILLMSMTLNASAQKETKAEKQARKEAMAKQQAAQDLINHHRALTSIENNQWAFQADALYGPNGEIINATSNEPNVAAFDGVNFMALLILGNPQKGYIPYGIDSNGKFLSKRTDKKGNLVFKYTSYAPTASESTLTLYKDSDRAAILINYNGGTVNYIGKVMPVTECWYFMTYERKKKK